jgi:hemerythrin-like domain-containing protein
MGMGTVSRRRFLAGALAGGVAIAGGAHVMAAEQGEKKSAPVTPGEDLMYEHAAIGRMLLIYERCADRIAEGEAVPAAAVAATARTLREFGEDYHAKTEEEFVFPRFQQGRYAEMSKILKAQHDQGRRITDAVLQLTKAEKVSEGARLATLLRQYARMYVPHADREASTMFRDLQASMSEAEYHQLGEKFEEREHKLFGEGGFQKIIARIADVEKQLGLADLEQFTPK